jgi:hypothetical protein
MTLSCATPAWAPSSGFDENLVFAAGGNRHP